MFTIFRKYLIIFIDSTRFREIPIKIGTKIDEFSRNIVKFSKLWQTIGNIFSDFQTKIELRELCKGVHLNFCRSRRELSNEYLLAKFGFDTAENEPFKIR